MSVGNRCGVLRSAAVHSTPLVFVVENEVESAVFEYAHDAVQDPEFRLLVAFLNNFLLSLTWTWLSPPTLPARIRKLAGSVWSLNRSVIKRPQRTLDRPRLTLVSSDIFGETLNENQQLLDEIRDLKDTVIDS